MDDYKQAHEIPELRTLFGFSYQKTLPQYFASFDQRLLAAAIDYFLLLLGAVFLLLLSFSFIGGKEQRIFFSLLFLSALPLFKLVYSVFADASAKQGTAGKRVLNIRVTDMEGSRINLGVSLVRNTAKVLSVLPFFFGYLYLFLNRKHQAWHDITANTLVIKDRLI